MRRLLPVLLIGAAGALALAALFPAGEAAAIPAFARKYRMSCTTCHQPFARLKAYGDDFAGNGFRLADKEAPGYFVETGDPNLSLIRDFPLSARIEGWARHETGTRRETDFSTPYNVKLMSGGALGNHLAYYFSFLLSERGEVAGVEDAYLMFNDLFGQDLDLYVGQFQISDPLFKRELRLTFDDYAVYVASPGASGINLKYDRGLMVTYGAPTGTDVAVELVNGSGLAEGEGNRHVYDRDKYKNLLARVSQNLNEYLRAGIFGFYGKEADEYDRRNEVWMAGGDATVGWGPAELNLQYVERRDDNPGFSLPADANEVETRGGFAELIVWPKGDRSRWYGAAMFNYVESGLSMEPFAQKMYRVVTGHVGYLLQTNLRLTLENSYDLEAEENSLLAGFVSAF